MDQPSRDELIDMRTKGMTRAEIADHFDVKIATVRRWIRIMNIPRPAGRSRRSRNDRTSATGEIIALPDDGYTLMEKAEMILGSRLKERRGFGYYLDGRPARTDAILAAAKLKPKDE